MKIQKIFQALFSILILAKAALLHEGDHKHHHDEEPKVCGGFIEFDSNMSQELKKQIDYSNILVQSFTTDMILKEHTNLAASGYYFLPVYENESFILKISAPYGMNFEPEQYVFNVDANRTIVDICQHDINFKFRGYVVEGQISTFGTNAGPEGISLVLFNEEGQKIQTTKTVEQGLFRFKPTIPGNYVIKPLEDVDIFDKNHNEFKLTVNIKSSNFFEKVLIIRGFKVVGKIVADNDPLSGAVALIYTNNVTLVKDYNCEGSPITNLNEQVYNNLTPFCAASTNSEGIFTFNNIPYGSFIVRPIVKNQYVSYGTDPESQNVEVGHKDNKIKAPFQVGKFSVYGTVVNHKNNGVPHVTIKIDGQVKASSDEVGVYKLSNLVSGNYDLEAQANDMFFEPLTNIRITPHLKKLPDLVVTDYKLCGTIQIEAKDYYSTSKRTVVLQDASKSSKKEQRTITDQRGKYCFEVKPGTYHIFPVLTQEEKDSDLHLQPESYDLQIVDSPKLDVDFYQSKVAVFGKVVVLNETEPNIKVHLVSMKTDKIVIFTLNSRFQQL